jgi:hypothetical protein
LQSSELTVENLEELIFPLVVFNRNEKAFECLGTGFFITPDGWFVTAAHVLNNYIGKTEIDVIGIQTTDKKERHVRFLTHYHIHPTADIMIGKLGWSHDEHTNLIDTMPPLIAKLDLTRKPSGEKLISYGFPLTRSSTEDTKTKFNFKYGKYAGNVVEWVEKSPRLNYPCYHTNLDFKSGASGGPVFSKIGVIGIHSTNFDFQEEGDAVSYVTPISMILGLPIINSNGEMITCFDALSPVPDESQTLE